MTPTPVHCSLHLPVQHSELTLVPCPLSLGSHDAMFDNHAPPPSLLPPPSSQDLDLDLNPCPACVPTTYLTKCRWTYRIRASWPSGASAFCFSHVFFHSLFCLGVFRKLALFKLRSQSPLLAAGCPLCTAAHHIKHTWHPRSFPPRNPTRREGLTSSCFPRQRLSFFCPLQSLPEVLSLSIGAILHTPPCVLSFAQSR